MNNDTRNSFGLYDAPIRSAEKERITLTEADIERQLEAGAFALDWTEAVESGFINPDHEPDSVIVDVREGDV